MFLCGDIGGTRSRFYAVENNQLVIEKIYSSKEFSSLIAILEKFIEETKCRFSAAVIGIAGPIVDGRCKTTNLPWEVTVDSLKKTLGIQSVYLVNDLELLSLGLWSIDPSMLEVIQTGQVRQGPVLVGCPGTGLGIACITHKTPLWEVMPTEAGHIDFAPKNEEEIKLLQYFMDRNDHVSLEKFVSGPGLYHLYEYRCDIFKTPKVFKSSEEITDKALINKDPVALEVCYLFLDLLASCLGNFALTYMALGGVYMPGALMRKLAPLIHKKRFIENFSAKGRLKSLLETFPIFLVKEAKIAIRGAQLYYQNIGKKHHGI